ncbi:MAG TPA: hypothetical protein VNT99_17250, partial [Methylomirabilota bacterium]|nr:hypothetical protein [Methylomirabilota bacterium]
MRKKQITIQARTLFAIIPRTMKAAALLLVLGAVPISMAQTVVVPFNQAYKYDQNNIDLGTAWREVIYDETGWSNASPGPLGFPAAEALTGGTIGVSGLSIQTVLNRFMPPPNGATQPRTYYFRTTFNFTNDPANVVLLSSNLIDDAAVFYLNGVEIGRVAFPPPPAVITHASEGTRAATDVTTSGWDVFTNFTPASLIQGINVYAVEVHQTGGGSSDLVFA